MTMTRCYDAKRKVWMVNYLDGRGWNPEHGGPLKSGDSQKLNPVEAVQELTRLARAGRLHAQDKAALRVMLQKARAHLSPEVRIREAERSLAETRGDEPTSMDVLETQRLKERESARRFFAQDV
jgi:hypothetical protein